MMNKLLSVVSHPITTINTLKDINLQDLPISDLANVSTHSDELILWNKLSAMIDYTYPMDKLQKTTADPQLWKELKYCIKFAAYVYFMPILGNPDPKHIAIKDKYIPAIGHKTKHIAEPGYFIGIDETNKRILLCIRGTSTPGDTITDLDCRPERKSFGVNQNGPFYNCHPGIFDAAHRLHTKFNVTDKIKQYLAEEGREDYTVFVTGHSLGAGVCSMLGLLWKSQNIFDDDKFKCFSFASPLVIDKDGVNKSISNMNQNDSQINMISVAVESDIVTRLSWKGMVQLSKRIELISKNKKVYETLYAKIQKSRTKTSKMTRAELDSLTPLTNVLDISYVEEKSSSDGDFWPLNGTSTLNEIKTKQMADLYPAGRVLWFVPDCVVDDDIGYNKYEQLSNLVELQTSPFSTVRVVQLLYDMISAFYVVDNNEKLCEFKDVSDRFEFTQMIIHGDESFHAHSQGRYSNGFGVDLLDVFRMSQTYRKLEQLKIPSSIIDIVLFIILIMAFCVLRFIGFIGDIIDLLF